jgi:hypothetical protein
MKDQGWTLKQHYASKVAELKSAKGNTEQQGKQLSEEQQRCLQDNLDKQAGAEKLFANVQTTLDEARKQAATSEKELKQTTTEIMCTISAWLISQGSAIASAMGKPEKEQSQIVTALPGMVSVDPGAPLKEIGNMVVGKFDKSTSQTERPEMRTIVGDLEVMMLDIVPVDEMDNSLEDSPLSPGASPTTHDVGFVPPERVGVSLEHGWRKYDRVEVWSKSQQTWIPDGIVSNLTTANLVIDGHNIPAHSVKVSYNGGLSKWIAAKDASSELRRALKPISDSDQLDSMTNFVKGAEVEVWSRSKNAWISDGTILDIAATDIALDGYIIPAGSVKVSCRSVDLVKWIGPSLRAVELRVVEPRAAELGTLSADVSHDVLAVRNENLSKDARVDVWSNSQKTWVPDGQVLQVLSKDAFVDGHNLSAGSVKVSYGAGNTKWLPHDLLATQLRKPGEPRSNESYSPSGSAPSPQQQKPHMPQPSVPCMTNQHKAQMPKVDSTSRDVRSVMHCLLEDMEQDCTSPSEKRARLMKKMVAEWHPDKRPLEEYELATRVCQWLNGPARCFAR